MWEWLNKQSGAGNAINGQKGYKRGLYTSYMYKKSLKGLKFFYNKNVIEAGYQVRRKIFFEKLRSTTGLLSKVHSVNS